MRKLGIVFFALGVLLAAGLYLLRDTAWFAAQQAMTMSDSYEIVESAFWASFGVIAFGGLLFGLSFRTPRQPEPELDPEEQAWTCPYCGSINDLGAAFCESCGMPLDLDQATQDWVCPRCGTVSHYDDNFCSSCGYRRYPG